MRNHLHDAGHGQRCRTINGAYAAFGDGAGQGEAVEQAVDRVRGLWHKFHDHLESMPSPEIYDVVADWSA